MKAEDLAKVNALRQKKAPDPNTITISRTKSKQDIERELKYHQELKASIEALAEVLEVKLKFPDIEPLTDRLETLHGLPDSFADIKNMSMAVSNKMERLLAYFDNKKKPEFRIQGFRNLWEMIIDQNIKSDEVSKQLNKQVITKFADLRTYIEQLTETIKQGQDPNDYKPVRIVIGGDGVPLAFLKQFPVARGGGGSSGTSGEVTIGDQPIDVTLTAGTTAVGKLLPPDIDVTTHTNYAKKYYTSAGAVTDGIVWSSAAGKRWHVVSMYINVSAAATVTLEDDLVAGDSVVFKSEFAGNSGTVINFSEKYPLASGEDAADLLVTTSAGNVYITVVGYEV